MASSHLASDMLRDRRGGGAGRTHLASGRMALGPSSGDSPAVASSTSPRPAGESHSRLNIWAELAADAGVSAEHCRRPVSGT